MLDSDNFKNDDISPYLPSTLAEMLGDHSNLKKSYKTKDLVQTITIFKDILKVFKYIDNSFGLFLVYNLVLLLQADFNNRKLKKQVEKSDSIQRRILLISVNTNESLNNDGELHFKDQFKVLFKHSSQHSL